MEHTYYWRIVAVNLSGGYQKGGSVFGGSIVPPKV